MKTKHLTIFTLICSLIAQASLYGMHPTRGQLTIPQTKDEEVAHALAIADIKKQQEKQTEQLETKKTVATQQAELNPVIFKNLPVDLQPNVFQFMPMPAECSAALLEHRELKIEHDNITAFAQIDQNQVATASRDGTLKIWDITTGKQTLELPQENCSIRSLIQVNDTTIAFGLADGTIKLWDITTNELIATCIGEGEAQHDFSIASLLKFSDRYIISASSFKVNAWDISDLANPRCIPLPGKFDSRSPLSKISDIHIAFATMFGALGEDIITLNLSDIKNPIREILPIDTSLITSCISISPSVMAYGSALSQVAHLINLSTKTTIALNEEPFVYNLGTGVCPLSANTFIACHGYGLKIWSIENPQHPTCIATIRNAHRCDYTIRLSDTSFACAGSNAIHIYQPDAKVSAEYCDLSFQNHLRFTALVAMLNKRHTTNPLTLNDIECNLFKRMPSAIKKALMKNFNFIHEESDDSADHKE